MVLLLMDRVPSAKEGKSSGGGEPRTTIMHPAGQSDLNGQYIDTTSHFSCGCLVRVTFIGDCVVALQDHQSDHFATTRLHTPRLASSVTKLSINLGF